MEVKVTCVLWRCAVALMTLGDPGRPGVYHQPCHGETEPYHLVLLHVDKCTTVCVVMQLNTLENRNNNSTVASYDHRNMEKCHMKCCKCYSIQVMFVKYLTGRL